MPGFSKSGKHAILVSLGKVLFNYPENPQVLVVYSSKGFFLAHVHVLDEFAATVLHILFIPGPKLKDNLPGMLKSCGKRRKE